MSSDKSPASSGKNQQGGNKAAKPETSATSKRGGRWNKLQRESSVRSTSPTPAQIAEKFATAARVVNKLKSSSIKKVVKSDFSLNRYPKNCYLIHRLMMKFWLLLELTTQRMKPMRRQMQLNVIETRMNCNMKNLSGVLALEH